MILQSDNGREFVAEIVQQVMSIWKDVVIVHGRPRHPQSQGSVERANQDVEAMIGHWMKDNNSKNWVLALPFVQLAKNTRVHSGIKNQPYILQYGQRCRHGCASLPIDRDVLLKLRSEDDLNAIMASIQFVTADTATVTDPIADADADASADAIADTSVHDAIAEAATDLDAIADASADMSAFAEAVADPDAPDEFGIAAETSVHDAIVFYEAATDIDAIAEYSADPDAIADASTAADPDAAAIAEAAADTSVHRFALAAAETSVHGFAVAAAAIPAENHCAKCKNRMSRDYLCKGCDNPIHWFCSEGDEEENEGKGHGKHYWCHPCYQQQAITVLANTVTQYSPQDKENNQPEHDTPGRGALRSMASGNQTQQAERMKKRLREDTIQDIPVGGICLVPIDRVDRSKIDPKRLPCIVVEVTPKQQYRLACKAGVLDMVLNRGDFAYEPNKTPVFYQLQDALQNWRTMKKVSIRTGSGHIAPSGGQGHYHCSCNGICDSKRCACVKGGHKCNSRCHPKNTRCRNKCD